MMRWRLKQKLVAGLLLILMMMGILAGGSLYGLLSYRQSNRVFDFLHRQRELLGNLDKAVQFVSRMKSPEQKLEALKIVRRLVGAYRESLQDAARRRLVRQSIEKQQEQLTYMLGQLKVYEQVLHDDRQAAGITRPQEWLWYGKPESDLHKNLEIALQSIGAYLDEEATGQIEIGRQNYRTSMAIFWSSLVFMVAALVLLAWIGFEHIFSPLRELHRGVTKLTAVNFDSRVLVNTGDELEELGDAFNHMADRLQEVYRHLEQQVEERSRQLIRSERLGHIGYVAAGVAHEINNPLAGIAFAAEALEHRLQGLISAKADETQIIRDYLQMIQTEAFRCKDITEKLLSMSRQDDTRKPVELTGLVSEVLTTAQINPKAQRRQLQFQLQEKEQQWFTLGNAAELKQVLNNLIYNALENTEDDGHVTLTIRPMQHDREERVEIIVQDDGIGMPAEVLEKIFEPFFTRNRTGKGTGLGLSITHMIISRHGGTLEASSKGPGTGSTFTIRLPLLTADALQAA